MVDVDLSQPPFSLLDEDGRKRVSGSLDLVYFDLGEIILDAGQPGESVFLIHKGEVAELDVSRSGELERIGHYTAGDLFGAISILRGRAGIDFGPNKRVSATCCPSRNSWRCAMTTPPLPSAFVATWRTRRACWPPSVLRGEASWLVPCWRVPGSACAGHIT